MKNILFLITVLTTIFSTQEIKAQLKDEVGHTVTQWSTWSTTQCHKGLAWRLRQNFYTGNNNGYTWEYEVKNNYGRQVTFSFKFSEGDESTGNSPGRKTLSANQVYRNTALPNAGNINYFVYSVCFSNDGRCKDECYSPCDNGSPNIPECATSNSSSSNNQTTNTNSNQSQTYSKPATTYSNSQSVKVQQKTEAINQLSQATISLISSIQDGARKRKELKQQQEENRNQQIVDNFNSNKEYYYDIITMENEELGYYVDYVAYQFGKMGYQLRKSPNSIIVGVPPYTKYGGRKQCYLYFTKDADTLFTSVDISLTDYKEENMKKFNKLQRNISVSSFSNTTSISQENLKILFTKMFGNIVTDIAVNGNKKYSYSNAKISISPTDIRNMTASLDFSNSTYKGHQIEFTKAITLDTANNKEAYKRNAYIYYSGLTGQLSDYDDAIEWYSKAAALGDTSSLSMMADLYMRKGEKDPENYGVAMRLYKEVAGFDCIFSTSACCSIAGMYERGSGVPKDCDLAIEWYEKAANSKSSNSYLGLMYLTSIYGKYGCKPDKQLNKNWKEKLCLADPDNFHCK